jgi:ABC-2 type transport system permease protein
VSREIVTALENTDTFIIYAYVDSMDEIQEAMDHGKINAAIIFPPDFSEEVGSINGDPILPVILNGAESIPATAALRAIEGVVLDYGEEIIIRRFGLNPEEFAGFDLSLRVWFNEALSEALYTTPAELALMLEFTILLFAALAFSREREFGTLEQLLVMPFSSLEIIIGKSIPVIIIGFFDFVLMLTMTHFVFDVPVRGSLFLLLFLAFGYIFVELGKGLVISVTTRTQHQAFLLVMLIGMVDFMFTGYAAPVESMPKVIQTFANLIPANHWLFILRGIMLKGSGLDVLWPHVLALVILGLVIGSFSLFYVRRALD